VFAVLTQLTFRYRCDDGVEGYCPDCGRPFSFIPQGRINYVHVDIIVLNSVIVTLVVRPASISSRSYNPDGRI
jgi:hypothetical protein